MKNYFVESTDGTRICVEVSGKGNCALLFSHGWLGNKKWWAEQAKEFEKDFTVARLDLGGHGESGKNRAEYSSRLYADDILAAANSLQANKIVLIGHSMSGAYILEAAPSLSNLHALILVDTLKNLDQAIDQKQVAAMFEAYRKDFAHAVENILPNFLFASGTPKAIKNQLQAEFLLRDPSFAISALETLYKMNYMTLAQKIAVPVRAINSDYIPTNIEANKKYFSNYSAKIMSGTGHYPMLENSEEFNRALRYFLEELKC